MLRKSNVFAGVTHEVIFLLNYIISYYATIYHIKEKLTLEKYIYS